MTTNVRDSLAQQFAADSRWSVDLRPQGISAILYVDNSSYSKILSTKGNAYMFAGNSSVIDVWKNSIVKAEAGTHDIDWGTLPVNGMAISVVDLTDGSVTFEYGHEIRLPDERAASASFAGSGSTSACACWSVHKDPVKAVMTAKQSDPFTGGEVRFLDFSTKSNNLVAESSLTDLHNSFKTEAMIMNTTQGMTGQPQPLKDLLASQGSLSAAVERVVSGELPPIAPCDAVYNTWTEKQRMKLVSAMATIYKKS
jgi:hypothetical protein